MATEPVSFETDVKPLFRERDREFDGVRLRPLVGR